MRNTKSARPSLVLLIALALAVAVSAGCIEDRTESGAGSAVESLAEPALTHVNERPNPYQRLEPWSDFPDGETWPAVIGVEAGPDGNLYVLHRCFENSCEGRWEPPVLKFDMSGSLLNSWGEGMFVFPHGFHIDPDGNVWASDTDQHQVFKFSSDGHLLMTLGQAGVSGDGPGTFDRPTDVLVTPSGDIFVTEGHGGAGNSRVSRYSGDGEFVDAWGVRGSAPGEFIDPHTIAIDSRGRLFVGDRANNRIQIFDQDGRYIDQWKQFGRPSGIFITPDDRIYVADSESWGPDNPGWKKGIRVGSARDGSVEFFIEDIESMTVDHSGAEGAGVDAEGNVYGAVVRRGMLEKHVLQ